MYPGSNKELPDATRAHRVVSGSWIHFRVLPPDMTTAPDCDHVRPADRLAEIRQRHVPGRAVTRFAELVAAEIPTLPGASRCCSSLTRCRIRATGRRRYPAAGHAVFRTIQELPNARAPGVCRLIISGGELNVYVA